MSSLLGVELACYGGVLLLVSYSDVKRRKIPNACLLVMWLLRALFLAHSFGADGADAVDGLLSSAGALLLTLLATLVCFPLFRHKTGAGDFKLLLVSGFCFGLDVYLYALLGTLALLLVFGAVWAIKKKKTRIPFAPFFTVGTAAAYLIVYM